MGLLTQLQGKRVYLDSNNLIYLLEGTPDFEPAIKDLVQGLNDRAFVACISTITLTEILPPLLRRADEATLGATIAFLRDSGHFQLIAINPEVAILAGVLRGQTTMKTPDALHVASAVEAGCEVFLTNDAGIRVPQGMKRLLMSDLTEA